MTRHSTYRRDKLSRMLDTVQIYRVSLSLWNQEFSGRLMSGAHFAQENRIKNFPPQIED